MGLYANRILPCLLHTAMQQEALRPFRARVAGAAAGRVLEIGIGSGLNLPFYGPNVRELVGIDPSPALLDRARQAYSPSRLAAEFVEGAAEALPFETGLFDTIVTTWTLCTIPDPGRALAEARRVLKPGGALLFIEHGHAIDEPGVARWQDWMDPLWTRIAGGCHLNRRIDTLLTGSGFRLDRLDTGHRVPGPRTHTFLYEGQARPR